MCCSAAVSRYYNIIIVKYVYRSSHSHASDTKMHVDASYIVIDALDL